MLSGIGIAPNTFAQLLGGNDAGIPAVRRVITAVAFVTAAARAAVSTRIPGRRQWVAIGSYLAAAAVDDDGGPCRRSGWPVSYLIFYMTIGLRGPVMAGLLPRARGCPCAAQ